DQLSFDGGEEGFGDGVVIGAAGGPERQRYAICPGQSSEVPTRILAAAVGMKDDAPGRAAPVKGHMQGVFDQLGAHVVGDSPAQYPAAGQVDDGGQVGEA